MYKKSVYKKAFYDYNFLLPIKSEENVKFLFILFMSISLPAFSDVVGTWAYSGSGCIASSLDFDTYVSKAPPDDDGVIEAIFKFKRNRTAGMEALYRDGKKQEESGNYTLKGDKINIDTWQEAVLTLQGDRIFIYQSDVPTYSGTCRRGDVFIFILAPVD